ncbi:hypothetical protein BBP40_005979 [Aspergillus hancockii]|nr:hypothetical protein BBP40_005979 [Aspergillus hancockii]
MPPGLLARQLDATNSATVSDYLSAQWKNPSDILSVLMLLGPDIVQRAVAQLAGRIVTPVAFSFGWVAYAASALLSSVGDGRLMPDVDVDNTVVVGCASGHFRTTKSWVLGRLLRDFEDAIDKEMKGERPHIPPGATLEPKEGPSAREREQGRAWEALRVTVFEVENEPSPGHGIPTLDWVWFSGWAVILTQLGIAVVAWAVDGSWDTFLITAAGNILALVEGSLPQWRKEKWACPKTGGGTVAITQGNGSRNAIVILGNRGVGLDLEILARGTRTAPTSWLTRIATACLAILWILLLISVAGMQQNKWYLFGIGLLGNIQNIIAAGAVRTPSAFGIHIKNVDTIRAARVAEVLKQVETRYPLVGTSLVDVFFPGSLRVKETSDIEFWRAALEARMRPNNYGTRLDCLLHHSMDNDKSL